MSKPQGIRFFKAPRLIEFQSSRFHTDDFKHIYMRFITFYTEQKIVAEYGSCVRNGHVQWVERETGDFLTIGDILNFIDTCSFSEMFIDLYVSDPYVGNPSLKAKRVYTYLIRRVYGKQHRNKPVYDLECVSDIKTFCCLNQLKGSVKRDCSI